MTAALSTKQKRIHAPSTRGKRTQGVVTLAEVARQAGVSTCTVSRVLNSAPKSVPIKPQTRQRVQQAARELGYIPHAAARALANGRTNIIGVVCYDISDPLVPPLLNAVKDEAEKQGYQLFIGTTPKDPVQEEVRGGAYISLLQEKRVDAVLVFGERIIEAEGYPATFPEISSAMGAGITKNGLVCAASIDHFGGGVAVGEHLASLGHRQVAFLTRIFSNKSAERRKEGIEEGLRKNGGTLISIEAEQGLSVADAGHRCIDTLLFKYPHITAAVARNDVMALGAMRALYEAGIRTPDQFSLVSWGDAYFSPLTCPSLTAISSPIQQAGTELTRELICALKNPASSPAHTMLPMELVIRESTGPVRGGLL